LGFFIGHFTFLIFHFEEGLLSTTSLVSDGSNVVTHINDGNPKQNLEIIPQLENDKRKMTNEK